MNTDTQRFWQRFKQHKLGFYSLNIFAVLMLICLFSNVIANDKPLLVRYAGQWFMPVIKDYPETAFGGVFETTAEYQDPAVQALINQQGSILWPLIRYSAEKPNLSLDVAFPSAPSRQNWLGTDDQGRDVLARLLYGLRVSMLFALCLTVLSALIGMMVGAVQGYYGGWIDLIGQRILEVWGGLPMLFLVMILVSLFTPNIYWLFVIMLLFAWPALVNIVRLEFLRARKMEYVLAAQAIGCSDTRIMLQHILPNVVHSSLSQLPLMLMANLTALTALDFLGYGLGAEAASMGELLLQAKNHLDAPWLVWTAFLSLAIILILLVFIGEALRDSLTPQDKHL